MLKSLWQRLGGTADAPPDPDLFDPERLAMLFACFPVGKRIKYVPEFLHNVTFQTLVIGYRANDRFLYTNDAIRRDGKGMVLGFGGEGREIPVRELKRLQVLLPDTSDMEKRLDVFTRAELGRAGQFRQGNTISLIAETEARGIPTVDTQVERLQVLKSGPFAETSTVLVTPDLTTLKLADKRRRQRVAAGIDANLMFGDGIGIPCTLEDISEIALRLSAGGGDGLPVLEAGCAVVVECDFGEGVAATHIRGPVLQSDASQCVVQLDYIARDGVFDRVRPIDMVEIKAALLNRSR